MKVYNGKVVIATCFYKKQTIADYCHSLCSTVIVLERLGIKFDYWPIMGDFHIERGLNGALTKFLEETDYTDIILIDSDESWNPQDIVRLLLHEEEVVGGLYLQTNKIRRYPAVLKTAEDGSHLGRMLPDGNCILEAERMPSGFMRINRSALEKFVAHYPDEWFWIEDKKIRSFFVNEVIDHVFYGMDIALSEKLRKSGVRLWVDPICDITHWGLTEYQGTYDQYLRNLKTTQDAQGAFAIVEQMAKEIEARNG
jgi:hypothetical protein